MKPARQEFTSRQHMISRDFEFYHYKDEHPVEVEYHNHLFYEVFSFVSGDVTYIVEGKSYRLKPGDIVLINNRELHKTIVRPGKAYERYVLWIDPDHIRTLGGDTDLTLCFERSAMRNYNLLRPRAEYYIMIKNAMTCLQNAIFSEDYGSGLLKRAYLTELLVYLNRAFLDSQDEDLELDVVYDEKVGSVINYINENLQEDLSLETLAAGFYTSKYHLLREFKKHTGYTIYQYIRKKRLITADASEGRSQGHRGRQRCGWHYSNFIRSFRKSSHPPGHYKSAAAQNDMF